MTVDTPVRLFTSRSFGDENFVDLRSFSFCSRRAEYSDGAWGKGPRWTREELLPQRVGLVAPELSTMVTGGWDALQNLLGDSGPLGSRSAPGLLVPPAP